MIKVKVDEKAPKTREYIKHLLTKFIEHHPLQEKEIIEIDINEKSTPFPKMVEVSDNYPDGKWITDDVDMRSERRVGKSIALDEYMNRVLYMKCALLPSGYNPTEEFSATLSFVIISPEKIYEDGRKYGILVPNENDLLGIRDPNIAQFDEDESQIIWRNEIVPIEYDTEQYYLCKYAFKLPVNKNISWGDVVDDVDEMNDSERERARNSINNLIHKINGKTEKLCGKPIFEWEKGAFRRLA